MQTILITRFERAEWSRLAIDAYRLGLSATGDRFMAAVSTGLPDMPIAEFDRLQAEYRQWLTAGFPGLELETLRAREARGEDVSKELEAYRLSMEGR